MLKKYKLSDVASQIEKVAFDVVRFKEQDDRANLWKIESSAEGDYIVAMYDQSEISKESNEWSAAVNKQASIVHVFYKNVEICSLPLSKLGGLSLEQAADLIPKKIAFNTDLKTKLLKLASNKSVLSQFPELTNGTR